MNKNLTHEEFLERLYEKNDLYRNGEIKIIGKYNGFINEIKIKYKGEYYNIKVRFLIKNITPTIRTGIFKESIIFKKFKEIHNNKYKYPDFKYQNTKQYINIECSKHGIFKQSISNHLIGNGCKKCSFTNWNYNLLIKKFKEIHNNKYKYPDFKYQNTKQYINIECSKHGTFKQTINEHKRGRGCKKCSDDNRRLNYKDVLKKFKQIHNNKYKYLNFIYLNKYQYISIICPKHGIFKQIISNHKRGKGCSKCARENNKKYNFLSKKLSLYWLKIYNNNEFFYKIGLTNNSIKERFRGKLKGYKYKKIHILEGNSQELIDLEYKIKQEYKDHQYIPKIKFGGYTECFSKNLFELNPELFKVKPPLLLTE